GGNHHEADLKYSKASAALSSVNNVGAVENTFPTAPTLDTRAFLLRLRLRIHSAASEVALPVCEAQVLFSEVGVDHINLHLAERAVLCLVQRRVGDEVLRAQLVLNLREGGAEVF